MSGEFRELYGRSGFAWTALSDMAEHADHGRHPISQALQPLYAALAEIEKGAAWFEACDSGFDAPVIALIKAGPALDAAMTELNRHRREYETIIARVIRDMEKSKP